MKSKIDPLKENEELLKAISKRQNELEKLTSRMVNLATKSKEIEQEVNVAHQWFFETLKSNNTNILSKAV